MTGARLRLVALGVLLATFVAGALAGLAVGRVLDAGEPGPAPAAARGPGARGGPAPAIFAPGSPLVDRLDLTAAQVDRIGAIVQADRAKVRQDFADIEPRLQARLDSTMTAIRGVLTADQRVEFDRIYSDRRARMRERLRAAPPRGPRGPPPGAGAVGM